jgi:replicative DNA helicase
MPPQDKEYVKIPPQAEEAELSVLGAMMLEKEAVSKAIQHLDSTAFYKDSHQAIFRAMIQLFNEGQPIDQVSVIDRLKRNKELDLAGGAYYVTGLVEATPSAANVEYYAQIVLERSLLRKLILASNEIQGEAYEATEGAFDILDRAEQRIFSLSQNRLRGGFKNFVDVLNRTFEHIDAIHNTEYHTTGIPTGLTGIDDLTSGFQDGELVIIAGRPGMGKTAFALTIARNAAVEYNIPVGIFSLEMADYQIAMRLLCAEARVNSHLVRTGKLPPEQWQRLSLQTGRLAKAPIFIDDAPALSMMEVRAKGRRLKAEHDVKMLIVDYLQLMRGPTRSESRQQEISEISRGLKALSKELKIPVVALSQLSRAVENRAGSHRPQLSDLRESGAIEQDADVVLFIYRPIVYARKEESEKTLEDRNKAEIIVAKQRNGPTGKVDLVFIEDYARFETLAMRPEEIVETPF